MALARKNLVDSDSACFYHCTNRCVRRAMLCGRDKQSGINYEHRKGWIEDRMLELCSIFSVEIYAYAVMSNHYHIVLYLNPKAPQQWSDEEVVERWLRVYPSQLDLPENQSLRQMKKEALMENPEKLKTYRQRLGSLSWYMRRLNEPLAKRCNNEDCCTGSFWETRFKSQALLDEGAVLSCMAYVDLNPIRAKSAKKLEDSSNTSIKKRITSLQETTAIELLDKNISPITPKNFHQKLNINLGDYIRLVEWAGQSITYPDKAKLSIHLKSVLENFNLQPNNWLKQIQHLEQNYTRAIGTTRKIQEQAKQLGARWLNGISAAKLLFIAPS